ncbi:MAG: hypothetical protein ACREMC_04220, partial [Gemmatimonadales bacterium]
MRGRILCAAVAALSAACVPADRGRRVSGTTDTLAVPADTSAPAAAAPTIPGPGAATKIGVVVGFLTPESVLH